MVTVVEVKSEPLYYTRIYSLDFILLKTDRNVKHYVRLNKIQSRAPVILQVVCDMSAFEQGNMFVLYGQSSNQGERFRV
jgi:hypothetical protein